MQIVIRNTGDFAVSFKYKPVLANFMRQIPGRKFDVQNKAWIIPIDSRENLEQVANHVSSNFEQVRWIDERVEQLPPDVFAIPPMPELTVLHGLKFEPKPYQQQGIARGLQLKRFMNADDPGLGKTFQTIGTLHIANAFPCLVICPGSVKYHWQREWTKFTDRRALVLTDDLVHGWPYYAKNGLFDVFITNFESLQKYFVSTITTPKGKPMLFQHIVFKDAVNLFKSVIIDESHRVKDFGAQQTKFTTGIADGIAEDKEWKITLTGTPVLNNHTDLIPQLRIMGRLNDFGGSSNFKQRFCSGPNKASNGRELRALLWQTCFFRRTKAEVKKDLPPVTREIIACDLSNRREYDFAERDLVNYLKQYKAETDTKKQLSMRKVAFQKMNVLTQISARGKVKAIVEHAKDFLSSGKKLLIYCELHAVVDELKKAFPKAVSITGREDAKQKQVAIDAFSRNQNVKLAIMSAAGGTGTDGLQNQCSDICLIEHPWHDGGCCQVESRLDRTGQKEPVTARYFQGLNTADEKKWRIVETKKKIADTINGGDDYSGNIVDMMAELFNQENEEK